MAVDMFLKLDGIDGVSEVDDYVRWIEIESFSWGASNSSTQATGGGGAGKTTLQDFHFTMLFNKASPEIFINSATGRHIKFGELHVLNVGESREVFLKIKMGDLLISSYQTGGTESFTVVDQVSLNFTTIDFNDKFFDSSRSTTA